MMGEAVCCECRADDFVNARSGRLRVIRTSHRVPGCFLLVNEWDKTEWRDDVGSHGSGPQCFTPPPLTLRQVKLSAFSLLILDRMDWRKAQHWRSSGGRYCPGSSSARLPIHD